MSQQVNWNAGRMVRIASSSQTIAANATTAFDFGTPNDVNLAAAGTAAAPTQDAAAALPHGDRLFLVLSAKRAAGTTDNLSFTIQDADDNAGSIGTPAAAVTDGTLPTLAAGSGAVGTAAVIGVKVQPGRPWIRVNAVHAGGGTDSFQCHATLFALK